MAPHGTAWHSMAQHGTAWHSTERARVQAAAGRARVGAADFWDARKKHLWFPTAAG